MEAVEPDTVCRNTVIYYDEHGIKYIKRIDPRDILSYPDERGNPSKKYFRVII